MKLKRLICVMSAALVLFLVIAAVGCAKPASTTTTTPVTTAAPKPTSSASTTAAPKTTSSAPVSTGTAKPTQSSALSSREQWAKEYADWEKKTYEAAKTEGKTVLYGNYPQQYTDDLTKAFEKAYPGVKLQIQFGRGDQNAARVTTEQDTGQQIASLFDIGLSVLRPMSTEGRVAEFVPPVAKEPGVAWSLDPLVEQANFPGKGFPIVYSLRSYGLVINNKLVTPDQEPKSWQDLTDPRWKGKIIAQDPRTSGGGQFTWYWIREVYGEQMWQKLAAQNIRFESSLETITRAVATGEFSLALPGSPVEMLSLKGAPLKWLVPKEGVIAGQSSIALLRGAPHPNAAKLVLNWFLMKEAQAITGQSQFKTPVRVEASQGLAPELSLAGYKILITTPKADLEVLPQLRNDVKKYIGG